MGEHSEPDMDPGRMWVELKPATLDDSLRLQIPNLPQVFEVTWVHTISFTARKI